ncbi:hypothetical protein mflW37_5730 [Mesoplasma florum W37]|uniref:Uncharacterized protein n=1 Tax=Mesoplasma florum TaxID=2151 RepID=A0AAD0MND6_MESFO|nr:hypothetical protein mflW37_5730 [Mesoplasma florum W37]AVN65978.1 hypothetical protein MflW12_5730 [Mesoplasma florum]
MSAGFWQETKELDTLAVKVTAPSNDNIFFITLYYQIN